MVDEDVEMEVEAQVDGDGCVHSERVSSSPLTGTAGSMAFLGESEPTDAATPEEEARTSPAFLASTSDDDHHLDTPR